MRVRVTGLAGCVPPLHRHSAADEAVELPVMLNERTGKVDPGKLLDSLRTSRFRQLRVQARQRRVQLAHQHNVALRGPAQGPLRTERLGVVGVDALPAEPIAEVVREGLLDEPVLAVDVSDHPPSAPFPSCFSTDCRTSPIT